jgi:PD-(D/E)XK nuclease superfamily
MSDYDFVIDGITFSYSSISTFKNCKYAWKLTYIDYKSRLANWYADFGLVSHSTLEGYFKDKLEIWDLPSYFTEHFNSDIKSAVPPYPKNIAEKYFEQSLQFFNDFDFDKSLYEVIFIEDKIEATYKDIKIVVKPDLLLKELGTGKYLLMDYKTADPYGKNVKPDKKKIEDYLHQLYLYSYFIWQVKNIAVDKIRIWFIRVGKMEEFEFDPYKAQEVVEEFFNEIENIKKEEKFEANNKNTFFCNQLCSVSEWCEYKK